MNPMAIEIRGLEKTFGKFHLGPLDLNVPTGSIYGFIGPNAAGKTTTIDLLLGMGREDAGAIRVFGLDHRKDEVEVKRRLGYVSPDLNFAPWGKVARLVHFLSGFYPGWDDARCRVLLDKLEIGLDDKIATMSFGTKIKLSLAMALAHSPDLLVLDEPTLGLDAVSKRAIFAELLAAVKDETRTVFIASHGLADLERFADHIGILKNGRLLLEGPTDTMVDRFRLIDFTGGNGSLPDGIPGLHMQERSTDRGRALVDLQTDAREQLKARGATELSVSPVSLEDLFVALVKGEE